ncbi:TonB-dependent siderophore receptor [Brucellaceae bacterium D45D]
MMRGFVGTALVIGVVSVGAVHAQQLLTVAPGPLGRALTQLGSQANVTIIIPSDLVRGMNSPGVSGASDVASAMDALLSGTGLVWTQPSPGTIQLSAPTQTGTDAVSSDGATLLQPIIVQSGGFTGYHTSDASIATGTDTPLRDVPQTVSVVGRDELKDRAATNLTTALEGIPNVGESTKSGNRGETFTIRGFRGSSYSIDGIPLNSAAARPEVMADLANVERVEVLKGPAAVLYGQGEPGGVINLVTRRPDATPGGEIAVEGGSFRHGNVDGTVTGPLNTDGTLKGRLTAAARTEDGFNGRPKSERLAISGILEWEATDQTNVTLGMEYTKMKQPFDKGLPVVGNNKVLEPYDTWLSEPWSMINAWKGRVTLGVTHELNDAITLRSRFAYDSAIEKDKGIDNVGIDLRPDGSTWVTRRFHDRRERTHGVNANLEAEFRFETGQIDHTVLTGFQYNNASLDFDSSRADVDPINAYDPVQGAPMPTETTPNSVFDKKLVSNSVFVQDQITFSEQWKALIGVRYDDYSVSNYAHLTDKYVENSEGSLTGRVGVVWQPHDDLALYASASQGFRPQTGVGRDNTNLAAEESEQFEIGAKWDINSALSANLSIFQITKTNIANSDLDNPGMGWSVLTGEERVRGIDLDVTGEITSRWNVRASFGYLDGVVTQDQSYEGNRLQGVPKINASLWTTYDVTEALKIGGGILYVGEREGDAANTFKIDDYTRLDAMASYKINHQTDFSLSVRNIADVEYIASTSGRIENHPGAPRTFLARLEHRF